MSGTGTRTGTDPATVARKAWETRPARRGEDTKIAGVAGAVARRYDLDPTLVRVAFVVWAIVGGGLLAYLLGWLALPADPADPPRRDRAAGGRPGGRRGAPPVLLIATVVVAIGTLVPAFDGRVVTFVALGLAAVALYLLHTSRAELGIPGTPGTPAPGTWALGGWPPRPPEVRDEVPVDWDALGADPAGWRLPPAAPAATPAAPREPRTRSVITPATIALALVAAGLAAAALLLGLPGVTAVWVPGAALAVVGLGLVVSALVPRTGRPRRGLVVVAIPLLIATVIAAVAVTQPDVVDGVGGSSGVGDLRATPTTAAQLLPSYSTGLGDVDLDLTRLAPGAPVATTVESGAGDITVTVPTTADVSVTCMAGFGDVDCLGRPGDTGTALVDPGPDGPGGQVIGLTVRSGAGDVAVRRG